MRAASAWADRVMRAGADAAGGTLTGVPYGGDRWLELPEDHPAHLGSVVLSAECWYRHGLFVREDLGDAETWLDYILATRMRSASWDVAGSPETWVALRRANVRAQAERHRAATAARWDAAREVTPC